MIDPDEMVLRSMLHIKTDEKAKPFLEWLKKNLADNRVFADTVYDEVALRQVQGGNGCLNSIILAIDNAQDSLITLHKNREQDRMKDRAL